MFTRKFLVGWRRKALRRRVWYSSLDRVERGILSLAARVVDRVESVVLGVVLVKILGKLRDALKGPFARKMETYGLEKARIISKTAVEWGHSAAVGWAHDFGFIRYLAALELNAPSGWGF